MSIKVSIKELQGQMALWTAHNFPNARSHQPLLGVGEEAGELMHAHLKMEQCIRGTHAEHIAAKSDAVGDIFIYLAHYCTLCGIDMEKAVIDSWNHVRNRDWIKFPKNGVTE